jgi:hypothetical protein
VVCLNQYDKKKEEILDLYQELIFIPGFFESVFVYLHLKNLIMIIIVTVALLMSSVTMNLDLFY